MIISYSRITLFSNRQNPNNNYIPYSTKFFFPVPKNRENTTKNSFKYEVFSENDSLYPISKLHRKENKIHDDDEMVVANKWRDFHGRNDWEGMIDPIDPLLRTLLIRYRDMVQACYNAYDLDRSCKIDPSLFFKITSRVNHGNYVASCANHGYDVANYIYSKCHTHSIWPSDWSHEANWIGYVAVSSDEYSTQLGRRDITIAWRKTMKDVEEIADIMELQRPTRDYNMPSRDPTIKIEAGLLNIYTRKHNECHVCKLSAREQVLTEVKRLIDRYSNEEISITITGHSLGGGLAIINAYDIAEIGLDVREDGRVIPLCIFSFSGPRVGNIRFKQRLEVLGVKVLRVVNKHDFEVQTKLIQKLGDFFWSYNWHVGEEIILDHKISPPSKEIHNLTYIHDLEVHLHLLNWFQGKGKGFSLQNMRNIYMERRITNLMIKTYIEMVKEGRKYRNIDIYNLKKQYVQQHCLKNQSPAKDEHQT